MAIRDVVVKAGAYAMLGSLALGVASTGPTALAGVLISAKASSTSAITVKVAAMVFGGMAVRYGPEIAFSACEKLSGAMYDGAFDQATKATRYVTAHIPFMKGSPTVKEATAPVEFASFVPQVAALAA